MEESIKWNVRALAANRKQSIEALAKDANIDPKHLQYVSVGRATMSATDLIRLAKVTGVSPFAIQTEY